MAACSQVYVCLTIRQPRQRALYQLAKTIYSCLKAFTAVLRFISLRLIKVDTYEADKHGV